MDFQYVRKLIEEPLFSYDRQKDTLSFTGAFENSLCTQENIVDFLYGREPLKLIEEKDREKLRRQWSAVLTEGETVFTELSLLASNQKYETFSIKGIYDASQDVIFGVLRNLEVRKRAVTDPLTGLLNRSGLDEKAPKVLNHTTRNSWTVLYLLDLDNFKEINDTRGHLLGDELLKTVAQILQEIFQEKSYIARIGGDEFVVIAYDRRKTTDIARMAEQVCTTMKTRFEEKNYGVTVSIGIGVSKRPISYSALFNQADMALFATKSDGKNGYRFYSPDLRNVKYTSNRSVNGAKNVSIVQDESFYKYHTLVNDAVDIVNRQLSPKDTIIEISRLVVESFDVSRVFGSCYMPDGLSIGRSYFYSRDNAPNIPPKLALNKVEYAKNFNEEGIFFCTDINKVNEPVRSELIYRKVESLLQFMIYDEEDNFIGTVGINNSGEKRLWMQDEIDIMQTIAKLMTGPIRALYKECEEEARQEKAAGKAEHPSEDTCE